MKRYPWMTAIGAALGLACLLMLFSGCASQKLPAFWANEFSAQAEGFERLALFVDFASVRNDAAGKIYLTLKEGLADAKALDESIKAALTEKGYSVSSDKHFFVGSYAREPMNVSFGDENASSLKEPPFHIDPEVTRVESHQKDILEAITNFSGATYASEDALKTFSLPPDLSQRIGGQYHTSGFILVIGQARRVKGPQSVWPPLTEERLLKMRTPFLAIGFFEAMTGKLVYFQRSQNVGDQKPETFIRIMESFLEPFPSMAGGSRFEIPPVPRYDLGKDSKTPFDAAPTEIIPNADAANVMAYLKSRGSIPFTKNPSPSRRDTTMLPSGTPVRILGKTDVYTKVVLEDGTVGWVPTSAVWIRK